MSKYRLRQYDAKNVVIEELLPGGLHPITKEQGPEHWEIVGYWGSVIDCIPELIKLLLVIPDTDLANQVASLSSQLADVKNEVIRIVREAK